MSICPTIFSCRFSASELAGSVYIEKYRRCKMAILYALVARGSVVLAEFTATDTNASVVARQILEKIPGTNDTHVSYSQDRYIFHVRRTDGLTVLCMADESFGRRIPFAFLEDTHKKFVRMYGRAVITAQAYAMNDEFSRVLSQQMEYYSNDQSADRINRLQGEMNQVRNVMVDNIDKVLDRGERLELLVDKSANMQENTFHFKRQARRFRSNVWWRNIKLILHWFLAIKCQFGEHAYNVCFDFRSAGDHLHHPCICMSWACPPKLHIVKPTLRTYV
ncbi:hypothetical protein V2J09_013522 [Rumex salicifolius]